MLRALAFAALLAGAAGLAGCVAAEPVETVDIVSDIPWTAPEEAHYILVNDDGDELGRGTLTIEDQDERIELALRFENEDDYDESVVLVDARTLKPISVERERQIDEERQRIEAEYDAAEEVVTITEIKEDEERRPLPFRLEENYYDNDSSLFLWRAIDFTEDYEAAYHTVVTGSGEQQVVRLRVIGKERVTVPAGAFDTWKLQVRAEGVTQTAWYADTPERTLVQYDNSIQIFRLTSLGTQED